MPSVWNQIEEEQQRQFSRVVRDEIRKYKTSQMDGADLEKLCEVVHQIGFFDCMRFSDREGGDNVSTLSVFIGIFVGIGIGTAIKMML